MILDSKVIPPPPPYALSLLPPFPGSSSSSSSSASMSTLPPHLLLQVIYATFPQTDLPDELKIQRQRKTLYWLSISLRLVNRTFYVASMHVLRSTHIPAYNLLIRYPYSSDPFPLLLPQSASQPTTTPSPLSTIQRETSTLDRFIALKVREDVWADDTELHLERDEAYKDLFDHAQPKSRLEDLVRDYGIRDGVISIGAPSSSSTANPSAAASSKSLAKPARAVSPLITTPPLLPPAPARASATPPTTSFFSSLFSRSSSKTPITPLPPPTASTSQNRTRTSTTVTPIPFYLLSISFSPRQVGLVLHQQGTKRTIVSVQRATRDEKLEIAAKRLVRELRGWLVEAT